MVSKTQWLILETNNVNTQELLSVIEKFGFFDGRVKDTETYMTECWDETNDSNKGNIRRETKTPEMNNLEMIYSGPHLFVANSMYKTPREICTEKGHYDIIDLVTIDEDYLARTNYVPNIPLEDYQNRFQVIPFNKKETNWLEYYKIAFRKMLSQAGERTLTGAIIPPNTCHIHGLISVTFQDIFRLLEFSSLSSSIILDFIMKSIGSSNLAIIRLNSLPLGVKEKYRDHLISRILMLSCLTKSYKNLWEKTWSKKFNSHNWSIEDHRLTEIMNRDSVWNLKTPLRNYFERRQALVEIDVITSMSLGLNINELISIYTSQFPVLQQNEDDTWYDQKGNIVFTCSKGLNGVGLDRPVWETIKDMKEGESYEHTIDKSELYYQEKVTYYAPFEKCDRVEDYKVAWAHFEKIFNQN